MKQHNASKREAPGTEGRAPPTRPMHSDLAPTGDSEKTSLPMSPILTGMRESMSKDLTIKGW
jgi:hypothetical protein